MDSDKQRVRFKISYDGTDFYGWQKQTKHSPTLQETLENSLSKIYDTKIQVMGSGRTDRGVHAIAQWAHADLPKNKDYKNLQYRLQRMTPETMSIQRVELAPPDFHAQISAVSKRYVYRMFVRKNPNPLIRRYSWHYKDRLDLQFLQEASDILLGTHDFSSFRSQGTAVSTPVRTLTRCQWVPRKSGFVDLHIQGDGFLKQMVRNIVGTLMWQHEKDKDPKVISNILSAQNRKQAGPPAPPQGLFLASVHYPRDLDIKCRKL